ncbi:MAG: hypothetical protein J1E95_07025 [Muribaculaceae bacterium]|nr:hypothetical protein [Muribaculaceae bacterium]
MYSLRNKYLTSLAVALFSMMSLSSCVYDKLNGDEPDIQHPYIEGNYLGMQIELPVMTRDGSAQSWEIYEDHVNQDSFKLIFVDAENDEVFKIFEASELSIIPIADSFKGAIKNWHIQIPLDEDFEEIIREKDFKIAVLANWPSEMTDLKELKSLHDLHHLLENNIENDFFSFLNQGTGKMSPYREYVVNKLTIDEEKADDWIRENWNPALEKNKNHPVLKDYYDLWLCWNFGGKLNAVEYPGKDYAVKYPDIVDAWEKRNGAYLRNWITKNIKEGETEGALVNLPIVAEEEPGEPEDNGKGGNEPDDPDQVDLDGDNQDDNPEDNEEIKKPDENYPLTFKTVNDAMGIRRTDGDDTYYGVKLPKGTLQLSEEGTLAEESQGVLSFLAPASGTLYITAKSTESNSVIKVQVGNNAETTKVQVGNNVKTTIDFGGSVETKSALIEITGDSPQIYIYNSSDTPVEIYQIEYVQGKYLYETARTGIELDKDEHTIPMYGIQSYKALENYWMPGTSFDLSNFNRVTGGTAMTPEYPFKNISLLRSVAKVVLLIPDGLLPHHVYLRSQNRYARCEPVDISTPTDEIWKDNTANSTTHSDKCEFFSIKGHKPFFKDTDYKNNLLWYYGSWGSDTFKVPKESYGAEGNSKQTDYPHIMNPLIERSEFTEFLHTGKEGDLERYVLYVPEKFVDDPSEAGNSDSDPKVCHIEFRIDDDPFYNIDDNECYRIYFTEQGYNKNYIPKFTNLEDNWEKVYEQNIDNLKTHWPIIRNHIYTFTVEDANKRYISANVKVLSWAKKDIEYEW